jgi:2-(1,2-epoxy-1,2-dihydrophenyl)acetyl-CoA isomerase
MNTTSQPVAYEAAGPVVTITLDSPATRNALDGRIIAALADAFLRLEQEPGLRVALLRANGRMFCPGADLGWLRPGETGMADRMDSVLATLHPALLRLRCLPAIVVAAVHGPVAGGGIGLMNLADLVIAADDATFSLAYTRIGGTPDLGATWHLPRLIGERRALELLLLSDGFDARRAQELGLVNFVVPAAEFVGAVDRLVERLAHGPAGAYATVKRLSYGAFDASLDEQLEAERRAIVAAADGWEFREGVQALLEKRPPRFDGGDAPDGSCTGSRERYP